MSARTHYFRIGVFVLAGAGLLIGALFAVGLKAYFGKKDVFETVVTGKVENLSVGALVKFRGVTIGKVSSIEFVGADHPKYRDQYVLIQFEVPRGTVWSAETEHIQPMLDAEAARGLRARVQGQGFLGADILALEYVDPGRYLAEPIPWTPKHYYIPSAPSQLNHIIASLEKGLDSVQDVDLAKLADRANALMSSVDHLVGKVDQLDFKQLGTNATSLILDLRETTRGLQRTLAAVQNAINGADLPGISRNTKALEEKLSTAVVDLRRLVANVDTGELNNSLANVRSATDELIVLMRELEQRPSSALFSRSPHPLPEMEKPPRK
jgi:phospholipid/cholesterol/gamma-HCH transport system substrate-binding protein